MEKINKKDLDKKEILNKKKIKEASNIYRTVFTRTSFKTSTGFLNKGKYKDIYI